MLSPDFAYFISFLVFVFFAYKYGHKKMKGVLDEQIQGIADTLTKSNTEKEKAQLALSAVKSDLHHFESTLQERVAAVEARMNEFQTQQRKQLSAHLLERENHHKMVLSNERAKHVDILKNELTTAVLQELQLAFSHSKELQSAFQEKSLSLIEEEFSKSRS